MQYSKTLVNIHLKSSFESVRKNVQLYNCKIV